MNSEPLQGSPPIVLSFAPSDPSGGAGLQADLLTLASMGCHPLSVVTSLTVQDTRGVEGSLPMDADWVADQARALLEDMPVDAFKISALPNVEVVTAIAEVLSDYPDVPLVLDPSLTAGRAAGPLHDAAMHALRDLLVPQSTLATANGLELRLLAGDDEDEEASVAACAARLVEAGCEFVLVTGTHHASREIVNTLYGKGGVVRTDTWARLPGPFKGAGATLSAAIAAMLANGLELADAVREAQDYTWNALRKAYRPGMGQFLPDRLFWAREESDARGEEADDAPPADARGSH
ncbi:MAG: hydroxymethylpyrimidine/phosphomethylpyrimidine kinase [Burkholderiales bacterium]